MSLPSRCRALLAGTLALLLLPAAAAQAETLLDTGLAASRAADRSCTERPAGGAGVVTRTVTTPAGGWVTARMEGAQSSDWDLAVFERGTNRLVGASAGFGMTEVAQGIAGTGAELIVQACRRSGSARTAELSVELERVDGSKPITVQLVRVDVPNEQRYQDLVELGLNMSDHGGHGHHDVVLYGEDDAEKLRQAKFTYTIRNHDLGATAAAARERDREFAARTRASALPSGRTTYRQLADYGNDMKKLVAENPGLVRPIVLPFKTYEGRTVEGIEIATNVDSADGRPVFLNMALHHAREWPSGEHAMEWAFELVNGHQSNDPRVRRLLASTRNIIVPVVNPDGFNMSRTAGQLQGAGGGRGGPETVNIATHPYEYRRKNCRVIGDPTAGTCAQPSFGLAEPGVDPNRNYGGFWGGPGADTNPVTQSYRGPGPFSEAETQNVRDLISKRHVTTLITNHTYSALVLRPPGLQAKGPPVDEPIYKALGDAMAAENGYLSQLSYELYDTTGTTEDWSYYATGGLGFTFEIGCEDLDREGNKCDAANFHPPYSRVVEEWEGTSAIADDLKPDGGGNREAFYIAAEHTADASKHSVLEGQAPPGAVLRLKKSFKTQTYPQADGKPIEFDDTLETTMSPGPDGRFEWHINPSTRPVVAKDQGRPATGEPSPPEEFGGGANPSAQPGFDYETDDETHWNDHGFTVPAGPGVDNAKARVRIEWATPVEDWDMKIFRDSNGDGSSVGETEEVGSSAQGTTDYEESTFVEPALKPGEKYVIRVINWSSLGTYEGTITYEGPDEYIPARTESWTLTCEEPDGTVLTSQQITIARGERQTPNLAACAAALGAGASQTPGTTTGPTVCASAAGFRSVTSTPRRRGVRFSFDRRESRPVTVDVFQVSTGRRVLKERLVARFRNRTRAFTWNGRQRPSGRAVRDGSYLFARFTMQLAGRTRDVRRQVLRKTGGRYVRQRDYYRREGCGLLRSYKLERPVFGGVRRTSLGVAFRLTQPARVTIRVLRGKRTVKTLVRDQQFTANRTHRTRLGARGRPRGTYRVVTTATRGGRTVRSTLFSRKL